MNFTKNEKELIGHWEFREGKMYKDENTKRVEWLTENCLRKLGSDESGWDILYVDPVDNRLWELIYFHRRNAWRRTTKPYKFRKKRLIKSTLITFRIICKLSSNPDISD